MEENGVGHGLALRSFQMQHSNALQKVSQGFPRYVYIMIYIHVLSSLSVHLSIRMCCMCINIPPWRERERFSDRRIDNGIGMIRDGKMDTCVTRLFNLYSSVAGVLVAPAMRRYQAIPGGPKLESSSPYHQAMNWANGINSCRVCVESGKFALFFASLHHHRLGL